MDEKRVPRLSTDRCKHCEHKEFRERMVIKNRVRMAYCVFWDDWLSKIRWCNK